MRETRKLLATGAAGVILLVPAACGGSSGGGGNDSTGSGQNADAGAVQHPTALVGDVGKDDSYTISLSDEDGEAITNLAAGEYELTVHDYSEIHNFHLSGPGVNESTSVGETGTKTFTVTFKPGSYHYQCDPHESSMNGDFTVS